MDETLWNATMMLLLLVLATGAFEEWMDRQTKRRRHFPTVDQPARKRSGRAA